LQILTSWANRWTVLLDFPTIFGCAKFLDQFQKFLEGDPYSPFRFFNQLLETEDIDKPYELFFKHTFRSFQLESWNFRWLKAIA